MGGRYQITQLDLSGCSLGPGVVRPFVFNSVEDVRGSCSAHASRLSLDDPKSEMPPGVLGAPKDANAPDPSPNAEEAPADGEETPVVEGERELKGFDRLCELSGPKRFDEWLRGRSTRAPPSLLSVPGVDRDNLPELQN